MEWRSAWEIGVEEIDAQHRELFHRIGSLLDAVSKGDGREVASTLAFLRTYVVEHFTAEQRMMARAGYPDADAHAVDHARFVSELRALEAQHAHDPSSPWPGTKLCVGLASWLRDHILSRDREFGDFLQNPAEAR